MKRKSNFKESNITDNKYRKLSYKEIGLEIKKK